MIILLLLILISLPVHANDYQTVTFDNRYTFEIPKNYTVKHNFTTKDFVKVLDEKGNIVLGVGFTPEKMFDPKKFGLLNRREVFSEMYSELTTNKEAIEYRKLILQSSRDLNVVEKNGFIFYKAKITDEDGFELTISTPVKNELIKVLFFNNDEKILNLFIGTFS